MILRGDCLALSRDLAYEEHSSLPEIGVQGIVLMSYSTLSTAEIPFPATFDRGLAVQDSETVNILMEGDTRSGLNRVLVVLVLSEMRVNQTNAYYLFEQQSTLGNFTQRPLGLSTRGPVTAGPERVVLVFP